MNIQFSKDTGLVPVIVQDVNTAQVLMLGYMNEEALQNTLESRKVTFYSRSKQRLWTKGEQSGNFLEFIDLRVDCDSDALLIQARPLGPTCHTGNQSCFGKLSERGFLYTLETQIEARLASGAADSYSVQLSRKGLSKMAQKVGEEAVELVIEAMRDEHERFQEEAADLLYHFLLLLQAKNLRLSDIEEVLFKRNKARPAQSENA